MADALELTILTPEKQFYKGKVKLVKSENSLGGFEILSNHVPMITVLKPSITEFTDLDGKNYKAFTSTGTLEIRNNKVVILCDSCEWPEDIDKMRAEAAKERAEKRLKEKEGQIDAERAKLALVRAITRLKIKS